jgi:hypothetical protein
VVVVSAAVAAVVPAVGRAAVAVAADAEAAG